MQAMQFESKSVDARVIARLHNAFGRLSDGELRNHVLVRNMGMNTMMIDIDTIQRRLVNYYRTRLQDATLQDFLRTWGTAEMDWSPT